ncbi:MAG: methyltransferase domain-containing protein [Hyphomicrobiales bacterium]|nr:methyltransferase domain-containing protein [Hyphomicrobiales bacterium]
MSEAGPIEARGALVLALRRAGIADVDVLRAIETVPREIFTPYRLRDLAEKDCPLPIACGQTMASPRLLATMLEALDLDPSQRVLEIGAGSGYATAVLARLSREIVSFEIYNALCIEARGRLEQLSVANAIIHHADGLDDPVRYGRFDRAIVHACLEAPPTEILGALAPGGKLVCALPAPSGQGEEIAVVDDAGLVARIGPARLGRVARSVSAAL